MAERVIEPTKCGECPLFVEGDRGDYCAHPDVLEHMHEPSYPHNEQRADGIWCVPDGKRWKLADEMPERCPLKKTPLTIRLRTT